MGEKGGRAGVNREIVYKQTQSKNCGTSEESNINWVEILWYLRYTR